MYGVNPESSAVDFFDPDKVMPFSENFFDIIPSKFHLKFRQLPAVGAFTVTSEMYRPDLVSYKIYKSVRYKNLLMEYNDIYAFTDLLAGFVVRYPSKAAIENIFLNLHAGEQA